MCLKWSRENLELRNPSLVLSNVPVLGQAWFPSPGKNTSASSPGALRKNALGMAGSANDAKKSSRWRKAPRVSLGMLLSAALLCVNTNSQCNVWICAGSRRGISTSPGSHQCSLLPAPKELPPQNKKKIKKKSGIFFCANTQYYCEMNPLYFYFLSLSLFFFFFLSWRMCCSFTWNEACTKLDFLGGFFLGVTASRTTAVVTGELH